MGFPKISWFPGFQVIKFDILLNCGILDIPDILNYRGSSLWTSAKPGLGRDAPFPVAGPLKAPQGPSRALNPLIYILLHSGVGMRRSYPFSLEAHGPL